MNIPQIELVPIDKLKLDVNNPNEMTDAQLQALQKGVAEYGFIIPVITNRDFVVADGHQRLTVAKRLGYTEVPVVRLDIDEVDRLILQQVLNKLRGQHREERDARAFRELYEAERLGKLATMMAVKENRLLALMEKHTENRLTGDLDHVPTASETLAKSIKVGDVFVMGSHRVVCGDAKDPLVWQTLMQDEKADCVFTDPPYGVSYVGNNNPNGKDWGGITNDDLRGDDLQDFLTPTFKKANEYTKPKAPMYCFYASINHVFFEYALQDAGWRVKQQLIWDKGHILGHSDYHWAHEPIMYCAKKEQNCEWFGDRTQKTIILSMTVPQLQSMTKDELVALVQGIHDQSTVWQIRRDNVRDYEHATQKPVALASKAIKNSTRPTGIVVDMFGGSGSTLVACEATGRSARIIELEPKHVATIITRWEKLTGQKAVKT